MEFILLLQIAQLERCYLEPTSAAYNLNLRQITLNLNPNVSAQCDFPDEVLVEIFFHNSIETVQYVEQFYSFAETRQIVMKNVVVIDNGTLAAATPAVAYLRISSLYSTYEMQLTQFSRQTSQFDSCFDAEQSLFQPRLGSYSFTVYLTKACEVQIQQAHTYQLTFGQDSRNVPIQLGTNCNFDPTTHLLQCSETVDYQRQIQAPFTAARLVFNMDIGGVSYTSEISFASVQLGPVDQLFAQYTLSIYENNIFLNVIVDTDVEDTLIAQLDPNYDTIIYRMNCRNKQTGTLHSLSFQNEKYRQFRSAYSFVCADAECFAWLKDISNNETAYEYQFDITTLIGLSVDRFFGFKMQASPSCISRALALVDRDDRICVFVYVKNQEQCQVTGKRINVNAYIINPMVQEIVQAQFEMTHDFIEPVICLQCDGPCAGLGDPDAGILVRLREQQKEIGIGFVVSHANYNYGIVKIVAFVVGCVAIVGMIVDSIIKVVFFQKLCKEQKQKRRSKQT